MRVLKIHCDVFGVVIEFPLKLKLTGLCGLQFFHELGNMGGGVIIYFIGVGHGTMDHVPAILQSPAV